MKDRQCANILPVFQFNAKGKLPKCSVENILQDDAEIIDLQKYRLSEDKIQLVDLWNEFIQNIKCEKLPGFPVWSEYLHEPA